MKRSRKIAAISAAVGMLILILDGETAVTGARDGIALCIRTVIPCLFPFFILSIGLTGMLSGQKISFFRPFAGICGVPAGCEAILLTGFLGGYPIGAQSAAEAYRGGRISKAQANRMLAFCNQAGPSFLFGMLSSQFPDKWYLWLLWSIQILSAVMTAGLFPAVSDPTVAPEAFRSLSPAECLNRALRAMANVCGWVVLFRVMNAFLERWILWMLPVPLQVALTGILELTNGCVRLTEIENTGLRFLLCAGILSFGGICVSMQTVSVTRGLDVRSYFHGKAAQTLFCLGLAALAQQLLPAGERIDLPIWLIIPVLTIPFLLRKAQKRGSISAPVGV